MGEEFQRLPFEPFFLEVLLRASEAVVFSLERLLSHIGLPREQMIACGDGYNDLTMIQYAGLGVAMENAVLPVRKAADFITYSNNDDGVVWRGGEVYAVEDLADSHKMYILREQMKNKIFIKIGKIIDFKILNMLI